MLASSSDDTLVRLWRVENGELLVVIGDQSREVNSVIWSQDGAQLATGSGDGLIRIWGLPGVE